MADEAMTVVSWDDAMEALRAASTSEAKTRDEKRRRGYLVDLAIMDLHKATRTEKERADTEAAALKHSIAGRAARAIAAAKAAIK